MKVLMKWPFKKDNKEDLEWNLELSRGFSSRRDGKELVYGEGSTLEYMMDEEDPEKEEGDKTSCIGGEKNKVTLGSKHKGNAVLKDEYDLNYLMENKEDTHNNLPIDFTHMNAFHKDTILGMFEATLRMNDTLQQIIKYLIEEVKK